MRSSLGKQTGSWRHCSHSKKREGTTLPKGCQKALKTFPKEAMILWTEQGRWSPAAFCRTLGSNGASHCLAQCAIGLAAVDVAVFVAFRLAWPSALGWHGTDYDHHLGARDRTIELAGAEQPTYNEIDPISIYEPWPSPRSFSGVILQRVMDQGFTHAQMGFRKW